MGPGEAMVENLCAGCHAIGAYDQSAHPEAPALRDLSKQIDLASLEQPLRDGIMVDHPDMPEFAFEPHHVDALLYYLEHMDFPRFDGQFLIYRTGCFHAENEEPVPCGIQGAYCCAGPIGSQRRESSARV
jgi:hypothetical protein